MMEKATMWSFFMLSLYLLIYANNKKHDIGSDLQKNC
jgi:hypothetical protein